MGTTEHLRQQPQREGVAEHGGPAQERPVVGRQRVELDGDQLFHRLRRLVEVLAPGRPRAPAPAGTAGGRRPGGSGPRRSRAAAGGPGTRRRRAAAPSPATGARARGSGRRHSGRQPVTASRRVTTTSHGRRRDSAAIRAEDARAGRVEQVGVLDEQQRSGVSPFAASRSTTSSCTASVRNCSSRAPTRPSSSARSRSSTAPSSGSRGVSSGASRSTSSRTRLGGHGRGPAPRRCRAPATAGSAPRRTA